MRKQQAYDKAFFAYTDRMALRSAEVVLPLVRQHFDVHSVVDFGCGNGGWLAVWKKLGVRECQGVDGDYLDTAGLLIDKSEFMSHDLGQPMVLGRRFDLAQSLKVAEHLPAADADSFVDTLVAHADVILFSAASPGQGGMFHVNERPYEWWRDKFAARGYVLLDLVRPAIRDKPAVEPWYRYNTFVFVKESRYEGLPGAVRSSRIDDGRPVPDLSPLPYRIRKAILRPLPTQVVNLISRLHTLWARMRMGKGICASSDEG